MNKLSFLFIGLVSLLLSSCGGYERYTRTPDDADALSNAVAALVTYSLDTDRYEIFCTAVFVDETALLTAHHCVDGALEMDIPVRVITYKEWLHGDPEDLVGYGHDFSVIDDNPDSDLSLLAPTIHGASGPHTWVSVEDEGPTAGENVIILGHPAGIGWTLTSGIVSASARRGWESNDDSLLFLQTDAAAYYGNSGGPVLDYRDRLVGIISQGFPNARITMAVHVRKIRAFLEGRDDE